MGLSINMISLFIEFKVFLDEIKEVPKLVMLEVAFVVIILCAYKQLVLSDNC